jgi:putative nucleotidyltransferase with HDIG domain
VYVSIAFVFSEPLAALARLSPVSLYLFGMLTMLMYAGAALYFWRAFRRSHRLSEAGLALASSLLAEAVISMALMPLWHASWWLYHVLMALAFMSALGAVVVEYESVRHFNLKHYFAALGAVVTVLFATLSGDLAARIFGPLVNPASINQVRWGTSGIFIGMASLMLILLYQVVRRGDQLLNDRTLALQKQESSLARARMAEALVPIGLALGATLDLDRVLDTICEESLRLFAADGAYLWLIEGAELVGRAGRGQRRDVVLGQHRSLDAGVPGAFEARMLSERKPMLQNFTSVQHPLAGEMAAGLNACAVLAVPFVTNGEVLGVLMLTHTRAGEAFDPVDLEVATIVGQQAALALTHARLVATIRHQLYELSTILSVSTTLRQAVGQGEVIQILLTQATNTLKVLGGAVQLIDVIRGDVHIPFALNAMAALQGMRFPLAGSLVAHVVDNRRPDVAEVLAGNGATPREFQSLGPVDYSILTLPMRAGDNAVGALSLAFASRKPTGDDLRLAQTIAEIGGIAIQRAALHEKTDQQAEALTVAYRDLRDSYQATLQALSAALDARDRETEGHSQRVTRYALHLARALGLVDQQTLESLKWGALLHDVGKIGVPDAILLKPAQLSDEEWQHMRRHPETGFAILRDIAFLQRALDVVLHHHERWDGSGYPGGLRAEAIPLAARIFAVADTLDAITTTRPYRAGRSYAEARAEILSHRGLQFDPVVVDAFASIPDADWQALAAHIPARHLV